MLKWTYITFCINKMTAEKAVIFLVNVFITHLLYKYMNRYIMKVPKRANSKESEDFSMYNYEHNSMNQYHSMQTAQFYAFKEVYSIVGHAMAKFAKVFTR